MAPKINYKIKIKLITKNNLTLTKNNTKNYPNH